MTTELVAGLALFALASSITPGPNNLMLMASGTNHGFRKTLPHLLGVVLGFVVMVLMIGAWISDLFSRFPLSLLLLRIASSIYLGWLAIRLVRSVSIADNGQRGEPMTFLQAALFQWVNPKSWAMALTAVTLYAPGSGLVDLFLVASLFGLINLPAVSLWALLGQRLRHFLLHETHLQRFNAGMALLLIASLLPMVLT